MFFVEVQQGGIKEGYKIVNYNKEKWVYSGNRGIKMAEIAKSVLFLVPENSC